MIKKIKSWFKYYFHKYEKIEPKIAEKVQKQTIIFKEYQNQILKRLRKNEMEEGSKFELIDGFLKNDIHKQLDSGFKIGGPCIPLVSIINSKTGELHFFALKAILPDVEI